MTLVKRLLITASDSYNTNKQILPINSGEKVSIDSKIGKFDIIVNMKNFDGSKPHLSNSFYNANSSKCLMNDTIRIRNEDALNLQIQIVFTPSHDITASDLVFGVDIPTPVKEIIPVHLLSTGLKFFTWFINGNIKADIYSNHPFLYGLAINIFDHMNLGSKRQKLENLNETVDLDTSLHIPTKPNARKKYFLDKNRCNKFVYRQKQPYFMEFDTNLVKMLDSKYAIAIRTFGNKTFDIDVSKYANEKLNNFNWVLKCGGMDGVENGELGLILNFALLEEAEDDI